MYVLVYICHLSAISGSGKSDHYELSWFSCYGLVVFQRNITSGHITLAIPKLAGIHSLVQAQHSQVVQ